ncbi:MAG TPA: hypothetical protein VMT46_09140 [Anaerolineaceae bacterium]|nr:hypothetical protein [Anaerolineaceae bacterium]
MNGVDLVVAIVSFLLTLLVLSYVFLGDTPLFRFATHAFVGVAAAYVVLVTFEQVILPRLILPFVNGDVFRQPATLPIYIIPLVLGILLLFKLSPRLGRIGSPSVAFLVGVGAAVIIGGVVLGTLFPQTTATANLFGRQNLTSRGSDAGSVGVALIDALYILVGAICTLAFFHFTGRPRPNLPPKRHPAIEALAKGGQFFIAITFGSLFAGVYMAALAALVERITYLVNLFKNFTL